VSTACDWFSCKERRVYQILSNKARKAKEFDKLIILPSVFSKKSNKRNPKKQGKSKGLKDIFDYNKSDVSRTENSG
jgi:hypothetical protein